MVVCIADVSAKTDSLISDFRKADSIAALYPRHSLRDMKSLAEKLTMPLHTEEEKFRVIYKWVCNNIDNDYALNQQNQLKREKIKDPQELKDWNTKIGWKVIRNLVDKQQTVCTGYAYLLRELSMDAGLSCIIIDGYGRTVQSNVRGEGRVNHSWNAIRLRNQWYLCDATWSAGAYDMQLHEYVKNYNNDYFLAEPVLFIRNHYPLDSAWMLLKDKPTLSEFLSRPLIYPGFYHYQVTKLLPETFNAKAVKGKMFSFQLEAKDTIKVNKVELIIKSSNAVKSFYPPLTKTSNDLYTIDHVFTQKGTHIVHVRFDDNYVCTYTVNVK